MTDSTDPAASEAAEIAKDIAALSAYRRSRLAFNLRIAEASRDQSDSILEALRTDATYQVAEFFYLIAGFGIRTPGQFDDLIERHNEYVSSLLADPDKAKRMGLSRERLLGSIFDGETKPRILRLWSDDPGTIDQSSMARFLVAVMSDETARRTLVACGKAGLLERRPSVFRMVLVKSTGRLEAIYGQCLREVRLSIQGQS